jgi:hypothetical protein
MATRRTLLLVAGSGRSGTSLFSGVLQRLGFHVPQPEVPADETNPRGFAESQWVVDFHTELLARAGVQVADARPAAWAHAAEVGFDPAVLQRLGAWLDQQFAEADDLVIKDPRLSWFLPLWRRCGEAAGAAPRFVTMLRHPAAVIDSKQRSYGAWQTDVGRAAGWVNQTVFTERATRDAPRAFVGYDDLLEDWTHTIGRVGAALDLAVIRDAPAPAMRRVHEFVDRSLSRSRPDWDDTRIPTPLRDLADEVWSLVSELGAESAPAGGLSGRLDAARAAYIELYEQAEAIAQSSVAASRRRREPPASRLPPTAAGLMRRVPRRYRHRIPLRVRQRIIAALAGR